MKEGRKLSDIAAQVMLAHKTKHDYVATTSAVSAVTVPTSSEFGAKAASVTGTTKTAQQVALQFKLEGKTRLFTPTTLCLNQIAQFTGIPAAYAERMRLEAPELLARNVDHWFKANPKPRMIRTLINGHNVARAFLGDTYRPLDNFDLFAAVMPHLEKAGCVVRSAEVTDTRLYIQASTERIQRPIEQVVNVNGKETRLRIVEAGVIIGNSEVGCGSIFVDPMMYDQWCTNGAVMQRTLKRRHVGGRNRNLLGEDGDAAEILFSEETRKQDDKAFWMKVNDVVDSTLKAENFNAFIDKLIACQKQDFGTAKPAEVVEVLAERMNLNGDEKENVLLHYMSGGDTTKFGLVQAVTRAAQDVPSYDRAVELERMGGQIIELPAMTFNPKLN